MKLLAATLLLLAGSAFADENNAWGISGDEILKHISKDHVHKWELMVTPEGKTYMVDTNPLTEDVIAEPMFKAERDVKFLLYTRKNPTVPQELISGDAASVQNSNFDPKKPIRVNIHGWNNNGRSEVNVVVRDAYLQKGDFNVIIVDWGKGANNLIYSISQGHISNVAKVTANLLIWLYKDFKAQVKQTVVSGHSLGGHTAGLTGKNLKEAGYLIPSVVAFDPAGPGFWENKPQDRVHTGDAEFVEVIHTNCGTLGYEKPIGDADFYANDGGSQPGCGIDLVGSCAHGRSFLYFAESILHDGFLAQKCNSYKEIRKNKCTVSGDPVRSGGEPHKVKPSGEYQFKTNKKSPFSQ